MVKAGEVVIAIAILVALTVTYGVVMGVLGALVFMLPGWAMVALGVVGLALMWDEPKESGE